MSYMIIQYFEVKWNPFSTDWQPRCSSSTKWPRYQVMNFLGCELQWRPQSKTVSQDTQGQIPITVPWQPIDQFLELRCRPSFAVKKAEKPALDGFMVSQWKPLSWWHFNRIQSQHTMQLTFTCSLFFIHTPKFVDEVWAREETWGFKFHAKTAETNGHPLQLFASKSSVNRSIERSSPCNSQPAEKARQLDQVFGRDAILPFWGAVHHHILHQTWSDMIRHDPTWSDMIWHGEKLSIPLQSPTSTNHYESLWVIVSH